jgi:hypothetical protein
MIRDTARNGGRRWPVKTFVLITSILFCARVLAAFAAAFSPCFAKLPWMDFASGLEEGIACCRAVALAAEAAGTEGWVVARRTGQDVGNPCIWSGITWARGEGG